MALDNLGVGVGKDKADQLMMHSIIKALDQINLEYFELYNLDFMIGKKWKSLSEIYLKNNMLMNIDYLNNYQAL